MDAAKLDVNNGYLDPHLICEAAHDGPESWKDDHPAFIGVKGKQARDKVRKAALQTAKENAALYIGNAFLAYHNC
jgi:hypothetical protein